MRSQGSGFIFGGRAPETEAASRTPYQSFFNFIFSKAEDSSQESPRLIRFGYKS